MKRHQLVEMVLLDGGDRLAISHSEMNPDEAGAAVAYLVRALARHCTGGDVEAIMGIVDAELKEAADDGRARDQRERRRME